MNNETRLKNDVIESSYRFSENDNYGGEMFIYINNQMPYATCYMCGVSKCKQIRYGNTSFGNENVMILCESCKKKMVDFLINN